MKRKFRIKETTVLYDNDFYLIEHLVQMKVLCFWITIKSYPFKYNFLANELYNLLNEDIVNIKLPNNYHTK